MAVVLVETSDVLMAVPMAVLWAFATVAMRVDEKAGARADLLVVLWAVSMAEM